MNLDVLPEFKVLDETDDWLVVDKAAPLIVHPANAGSEPTLLGGVEQLLAYEIANGAKPAIVNRLDRDTSGIVVIAKHQAAARQLGMMFQEREVEKGYQAMVYGWPDQDGWSCEEPLIRAGEVGRSEIWVKQVVHSQGKACHTEFRVEERFERKEGRFARVWCFPKTGRMHQLRVHLKHAGHPIVGDKLYAYEGAEYLEWMKNGWSHELAKRMLLPRHALHASHLSLIMEGCKVSWKADLPSDLKDFLAGYEYRRPAGLVVWNRDV